MFFHVKGKGNKNAQDLANGQAVKYTEGRNDKGPCAENVGPIAGVRTLAFSC
jgi:cold shock CspA family protein